MPVHNAGAFLEKSIGSVVAQSFQRWELVCVDDCSTDDSLTILRKFAQSCKRIRIASQEGKGLGHAKPLNKAIDLSCGAYIFPLDADDYLSNDVLQNTLDRLEETRADLCLPDMHFVDTRGNIKNSLVGCEGDRDVILSGREAVELSLTWRIHLKGLWRSNILKESKYDEEGFSAEYSGREQLLRCKTIAFCSGVYNYLQHQDAITKKMGLRQFYYVEIERKVKGFLVRNRFHDNLLSSYELARLRNIKAKLILYNENKSVLDGYERRQILFWLKRSHGDISARLIQQGTRDLGWGKRLAYALFARQYFLLFIVCVLRSKGSKRAAPEDQG